MSRDDHTREPSQHARNGKLSLAGHELEGISIAGQETCIIFPSANIVFDSGRCPQRSVYRQNLFITHEHLDHMGGIPFHISTRQMLSLSRTHLFVPDFIAQPVNGLLDAYRAFQRCEMPCEVTPMQIGQDYQVGRFLVKPFKTYHTVPSQGYLLRSQRTKLKAEYHGLPGQEIAAAKKRGEEITHHVVVPEIAFTGDTTVDFITDPANEEVFRARLLIMECTFLDDEMSVEDAKERGHMHIDDIVQHADKFQNEAILLIHFSSRYSRDRIQDLLDAKLPPGLRERCTPMLEGFR
ncbi:hypothetical protein WJX77_000874 [Trebouxia sp. C0004]